MTISPATLQSFNNELVKGLESLKEQRGALQKQLLGEQKEAAALEQQIAQLSNSLALATQEIKKKTLLRDEYDRLISETEEAYGKIVESSQTLLKVLHTEVQTLKNY
jgi:Sjoegren syndrome nuclear autoantigen 1